MIGEPEDLWLHARDVPGAHVIVRDNEGRAGADDGELFLEYRQAEALVFDNGRLKQATYDTAQGFGLRAVKDDAGGSGCVWRARVCLRTDTDGVCPPGRKRRCRIS